MRCMVLLLPSVVTAITVYVPGDYPDIQSAINAVIPGDTILVGLGTYTETIDFLGKDISVISEFGPGAAIIDGDGNGPVVSFQNGETWDALISGFRIRNGSANQGGGILCNNASPTITGNLIVYNEAESLGGGICCISSDAIISENTISNSEVCEGKGGGISLSGGSPVIYANLIMYNNADETEPFDGGRGGGLYADDNCSLFILGNVFQGNTANGFYFDNGRGGGICADNCSGIILCNDIVANGSMYGGGISLNQCDTVAVSNCIIAENTTFEPDGEGCGVYSIDSAHLDIQNCTVSENGTYGSAAITIHGSSTISIINSIVWANNPASPQIVLGGSITLDTEYTDLEGSQGAIQLDPGCTLIWGTGMIDVDPVFVPGPLSSYHLQEGVSLCIDAGNPGAAYNDPEDPGTPGMALWPALGTVRNDMGAYGGQGSIYWTEPWTGVSEGESTPDPLPVSMVCYPNPFSSSVGISIILNEPAWVDLSVFDLAGRQVGKLYSGVVSHGECNSSWIPEPGIPTGCYLIVLDARGQRAVRRAVLLR